MTLYARPSLAQPLCVVLSYDRNGYATYCRGRFEVAVDVALSAAAPCGGCVLELEAADALRRAGFAYVLPAPTSCEFTCTACGELYLFAGDHVCTPAALRTAGPHPLDRLVPHNPGPEEPDDIYSSDTPADDFDEMTVSDGPGPATSMEELSEEFERTWGEIVAEEAGTP